MRDVPVPFAGQVLPDPPENPRWDPGFVDRLLVDLFTHWGEWRQLGRLYAAHVPSYDRCCVVRDAVDWGRKLGFEIEGDRRLGYRVTGFRHPQQVYLLKPGAREQEHAEHQVPGQLSLVGETVG